MLQGIAGLLKVRPAEGRLVLWVSLLFACIQAGQGMGDNAASALFLLRFGVNFLPYMYIAAGGLTFVLTMAYSAGLGRYAKERFFLWVIAGFAALLLLERAALGLSLPALYPALWLTINGMGGILGTLVWNLAGEVCDARQAKRLFPLFTSAGILGSVVGNSITGLLARLLGTENLLPFYALLLGGAWIITRKVASAGFHGQQPSGGRSSLWSDLRAGFDYARGSSLMRLVAVASVLFSVLFFAVAFPFNKVVSASFPDEAGVAGFFGLFNSLTTASTFLVSLFLANRIFTRLGILYGVLLMPLTYVLCFAVFAFRYDLYGAVIARYLQLVILAGVAGTAWNALFNVVPPQKRGQVLAFNNGVPAQLGVALSGVLLIVADRAFTVQQVLWMGALAALLCGGLVWRMRAAYTQALVEALRAGRIEVFSAAEAGFSGLQGDDAALRVATSALQDARPATRRLAAEILGRLQSDQAIPALTQALTDPDAGARSAALEALGALRAASALEAVAGCLTDAQEPVRVAAARALSRLGAGERAAQLVVAWLASPDAALRRAAVETLGAAAPDPARDNRLLLFALDDPAPAVRRAAAQALAALPGDAVDEALAAHLSDPQEAVCAAVAAALRSRGQQSRPRVLAAIRPGSPLVDAALDALAPGDPATLAPLRSYAQHEIERARALRNQSAGLPGAGRAAAFLRERLHAQARRCENRLVKIVGVFGDERTMALVRKNLGAGGAESRAAALEALETVGDPQLARGIVSLLEEERRPAAAPAVIAALLDSPDPWLRILAIRAAPEMGLRELAPALRPYTTDPDALVCEAAGEALAQWGEGEPMDTLKTVSLLERVLILREIPIFAELSPEDLRQVAEIAREEWYPRDVAIFHQGDEGSQMYVIVEGRVLVTQTAGGQERTLAQRGVGDFVGEMAIIEALPRLATLRTQSDVRALAIDGESFKDILRERPEVSFAVLRSMSRRLREISV